MTLLPFLAINAASNISMHKINKVSYSLPDLQVQIVITLCWHLFSEWGKERVASSFAYIGGQYFIYKYHQPITTQINQDARPTIGNAPLTPIFRIQ
jgi:hypothetical protein